jgi:hypothetical protein
MTMTAIAAPATLPIMRVTALDSATRNEDRVTIQADVAAPPGFIGMQNERDEGGQSHGYRCPEGFRVTRTACLERAQFTNERSGNFA